METEIIAENNIVANTDKNDNKNNIEKITFKNDKLFKLNVHIRDEFITFDEGPHIYTITKNDVADSDYTSVTTWNHSHFEHFNANKVIDKMMASKKWSLSKYYGMTKEEIKKQWNTTGKDAREAGTKMHFDIECYYNGETLKTIANNTIEFSYFLQFAEEVKDLKSYRTEWMIYDEELKIAGSIDMVYENPDGTLDLCDWKRSKEIKTENKFQSALTECIKFLPDSNYWHYSLQLNTYKYIIEKNYGKKISGMYLVSMHPDNTDKTYQIFEVGDLQEEIRKLFELRKILLEKKSHK